MLINKIGLAGSGTMGAGIAQILASKGYPVILVDLEEKFLEVGKKIIDLNQKHLMEEGLLSEEEAKKTLERIHFSLDKQDFKDCDLIIESIVEQLPVKIEFWKEIEKIAREDAILASNTSGLSINAMSEAIKNKQRFIGMHWWNPPHILPLVELIKGDETKEEIVETLKALVESVGKQSVTVLKDTPGFIGNRLQFAVFREALNILEEGIATVEDIDKAMRYGPGFRYPGMGPFQTADFGGLDTFYYISSYLFRELSDAKEAPCLLRRMKERGELGVKALKGFYDYSEGKGEAAIAERDKRLFQQLKMRKTP